MSDQEDLTPVKLDFYFTSRWHLEPPKFEVLVDDETIARGEIDHHEDKGEAFHFDRTVNLERGKHRLSIRLWGKEHRHTLQDEQGNVLESQLLFIKRLDIDGVNLGKMINALSRVTIDGSDEIVLNQNVLGMNGYLHLDFAVPTYRWFLDHL